MTLNALVRSIATEASTAAFAFGVGRGVLYLPWFILLGISLVGLGLTGLTPREEEA